eukprot:scaffold90161_cov73-Cyclotella_meneghiniana.AAC.9
MVEGPGCTRNGRKSQTLVGKIVIASEPVVGEGMKCVPNDVAQTLAGQTLESVFTVGKELYLIFKESIDGAEYEKALRLHFGMNGSLNIRKADNKSSGVAPWKQNKQVSLRLYFSDSSTSRISILEAWDTNVSTRVSAEASRNKLFNLACKDACSTMFNAQEVFVSLRRDGHSLSVSDALLHQEIFPGVGNIIKVESMHRSQIDPRRIVCDLSDAELRRLIRHARKFSMDWLNTGRAGTKLVYNQTVCGTCNGMSVKMQKIGGNEDGGSTKGLMSRVTFWCVTCQPSAVNSSRSNQNNNPQSMAPAINKENTMQQSFRLAPTAVVPSIPAPQCPQHGTKTIKLCRTRNSTKQNNLRLFFTCKSRGCNYFSWADSKFPNCKCGGKAVLRVSKTEKSGGRWFLCCANTDRKSESNDGCGHFEWAKPEHIAPLGHHLTPLM